MTKNIAELQQNVRYINSLRESLLHEAETLRSLFELIEITLSNDNKISYILKTIDNISTHNISYDQNKQILTKIKNSLQTKENKKYVKHVFKIINVYININLPIVINKSGFDSIDYENLTSFIDNIKYDILMISRL